MWRSVEREEGVGECAAKGIGKGLGEVEGEMERERKNSEFVGKQASRWCEWC